MSTTIVEASEIEQSYLAGKFTLSSWLLTTDHKRIAVLYLISTTVFFFVGGTAAALMRLNLVVPQGLLNYPETYNRLFTMHGVIMVWFFLVPVVPPVIGNFILPLMIGARDLDSSAVTYQHW